MPSVKIKCPVTGKDVPTGMVMDLVSFANATLTNNTIQCPHCGKVHTWSKVDAFVE